MEYYLKIKIQKKLILSPFREDQKPTCGFYYNSNGILKLHDFATGEHFDIFDVVKKKYNITYYQALIRMNYEKDKFSNMDSNKLIKEEVVYTFTETTNFEYFDRYFITDRTLRRFKVRSVKTLYVNQNVSKRSNSNNPIFAYTFPSGKFKFYRPLTKGEDKWSGNAVITDIFGFYQLPTRGKIVFITSSAKDAMVLFEMGFNAIAFSSESISGKNSEVDKVITQLKKRFEHVIIFMDNDAPGLKAARKLATEFRLNYIHNPERTPKDISDYLQKYKLRNTRRMLKRRLIKIIKVEDSFMEFVKANSIQINL